MPVKRLKEFLDRQQIKYVSIHHSPAYTAPEIAASANVPGKDLAKSVIVKVDGELRIAVLPASKHVDLERLREAAEADSVALATEGEFKERFPDCELGAMPPFGRLYSMPVYVSVGLTEDEEIAFNAGTHRELIKLDYADFERIENPTIADFEF